MKPCRWALSQVQLREAVLSQDFIIQADMGEASVSLVSCNGKPCYKIWLL
ncbi:hypothetical protein BVRB_031420, partial [Beta vulgaris subsp. vulgaris]